MVKPPPDRIEIVKRLQGLLLPNETWSVSKQILGQHQHPYTPTNPHVIGNIREIVKMHFQHYQESIDTF